MNPQLRAFAREDFFVQSMIPDWAMQANLPERRGGDSLLHFC
jgi:hypothetical protein